MIDTKQEYAKVIRLKSIIIIRQEDEDIVIKKSKED